MMVAGGEGELKRVSYLRKEMKECQNGKGTKCKRIYEMMDAWEAQQYGNTCKDLINQGSFDMRFRNVSIFAPDQHDFLYGLSRHHP